MASPRAAFLPSPLLLLLAVAAAALLVSSCSASQQATAAGTSDKAAAAAAATTMGRATDPKCSQMARCNPAQCTDYCYLIGLVNQKGFCTFHGLQFYCCCPVPFRRAAAKTPAISS